MAGRAEIRTPMSDVQKYTGGVPLSSAVIARLLASCVFFFFFFVMFPRLKPTLLRGGRRIEAKGRNRLWRDRKVVDGVLEKNNGKTVGSIVQKLNDISFKVMRPFK